MKKLHKTIKKGHVTSHGTLWIVILTLFLIFSLQTTAGEARRQGSRKGYSQRRQRVGCLPTAHVISDPLTHSNRLLVLAADISPIDIISHLPVLSEDAHIPYIFVNSKEELGHASSTKRPTSCVMICPTMTRKPRKQDAIVEDKEDDYRELYDACLQEVQALDDKILL